MSRTDAENEVLQAEQQVAEAVRALKAARQKRDDAARAELPADQAPDAASGMRTMQAVDAVDAPPGYQKVTEGCAAVLAKRNTDGTQEVFYNPVQVVNRDLSTLAIRGYNDLRKEQPTKRGRCPKKGLRILEALSATGLRAIRYWKEIPDVDMILVNDLLPDAVAAIRRNLLFNRVPLDKVIPNCDDAVHLMQRLSWASQATSIPEPTYLKVHDPKEAGKHVEEEGTPFWQRKTASSDQADVLFSGEKMDVIDLDPYGTAAPFLDSTIACAEEGGLLCITCTDCDVLCGVHPEACHHKYGAITVKGRHCHEMAVRVLLACVERHANRHGKHIVPMVSLQIDFYVRVFVRIFTSRAESKLSIGKLGHLLQCSGCESFRVKPIGVVRVESKNRDQRKEEEKAARRANQERKRKRDDGEEAAKADVPAPEVPAPPAKVEAPAKEEQRPSAAVPPVPSRQEPRLKYATATTVNFHSTFSPLTHACNTCGRAVWVGGPIWTAPTHDRPFVERLIKKLDDNKDQFKAYKRVRALLAAARDELPDCPLFYHLATVSGSLNCPTIPTAKFNSALKNLGYRFSQVHCCPDGVKTDAPAEVVYDIVKQWHELLVSEGKASTHKQTGATVDIVAAPRRVTADFTLAEGSDVRAKATGESKWAKEHVPFWGPKPRAKGERKPEEAQPPAPAAEE